ncbi:Peptidase inhibitor 16 [Taenia crassiceps]|uniref:Peptidase inhibitor 16 n=1 Tax=Taenia crassiceps TaxID=6207 RepID=A0ABR4PZL1_9CEST
MGGITPSFTEAVCGYRNEEKRYDYFNNSCTGRCSHYTQMVWASSNLLGCSMRRCDGINPQWNDPQYLSVCQYKPPGNYRGMKPYEYGISCSKCPDGYSCYRNQCFKDAKCSQVYPLMGVWNEADRMVPKCRVFMG